MARLCGELYVGDHGMPGANGVFGTDPQVESPQQRLSWDEKLCFIVRCPLNHVKTVKILELKVIEHDSESDSP